MYNINKTNNTIHFAVEVVQILDVQHGLINTSRIPSQLYEFTILEGNCPTTASILKAISAGFREIQWGNDRFKDKVLHLKLNISVEKEGIVSIEAINIVEIPVDGADTPWKFLGINLPFDEYAQYRTVKNVDYSKNIKPAFLYKFFFITK